MSLWRTKVVAKKMASLVFFNRSYLLHIKAYFEEGGLSDYNFIYKKQYTRSQKQIPRLALWTNLFTTHRNCLYVISLHDS